MKPVQIAFAALAALLLAPLSLRSQTVPSSGLVGYWAGNGNANDSSTQGNNGSFAGPYVSGEAGQAFQVTPTTYFSAPDIPAYSFGTAFSVGFWFFGTPGPSSGFLGQDNGSGSNNKWLIDYNYAHANSFELHFNGTNGAYFIPSNVVSSFTNAWHQLTMVRNNANYSFYLDGSSIGTTTNSSAAFSDPTAPFTIGYEEPVLTYNGAIDEVVLYNRALTAGEVQQLAAPEPTASLYLVASLGVFGFVLRPRRCGGDSNS